DPGTSDSGRPCPRRVRHAALVDQTPLSRSPAYGRRDGMTASAASSSSKVTDSDAVPVTLKVNGKHYDLRIDPRTTLLDCLREHLHLTGSKKGCDHGQCGACTVHVNGRRVNSCLCLAAMQEGAEITTIEGIGQPENLHPMQ